MSTFFTIGHGTRAIGELVEILRDVGVDLLVDVRRFPGSRRNPQFAREALERDLPARGISYEWWGETLGGRRSAAPGAARHPAWRNDAFRAYADHMDTSEFIGARDALVARAAAGAVPAVMCAETLWWRCHRRLIADALVARGHEVVHLVQVGQSQPHQLHEAARLDDDGRVVYDVGVDRELDV